MKDLATPIGLAGIGPHRTTQQARNQFLDWRVAGIALLVALAYYVGAKIGFALTFQPHPVSFLWPPNSILLAALLFTPVRISVRDDGTGLPAEDVDRVFTHFCSTKPNGMGMGLTIVRSIVESHGGKLRAENVDEGARFFFTLPVTRKPEAREVA